MIETRRKSDFYRNYIFIDINWQERAEGKTKNLQIVKLY